MHSLEIVRRAGLIWVIAAAGVIGGADSSWAEAETENRRQPNILVLVADDLGYADLSCYGSQHAQTPHLDKLADEGLRLTDFYAAAPNCSPSRAGLLTGRTPSRTGIYSYIPPNGPHYLPADEVTVAEQLRDAGYDTAHMGKWHLNYDLLSDALPQPTDHGFNYWFATENNASPSHRNPNNFVRNGEAVGTLKGYSCDIVADEFLGWLDTTRDAKKPFFACVWFHETHTPIASPEELIKRHADAELADARYYANVENLDASIGRILASLDAAELSDETLVIFTSDNGGVRPESNGPLRERKSFVWEGGIREPGIFRWPGRIEPGSESDQPCGFVDLLPTFCKLAGAVTPDGRPLDGVSLLPLFDGKPLRRDRPLFWYFYRTRPAAAMRSGDWSLVGYHETRVPSSHALSREQMRWLKETPLTRFELFNLREDIGQQENVAEQHPQKFEQMKEEMIKLHREVVDEGPMWFSDERP